MLGISSTVASGCRCSGSESTNGCRLRWLVTRRSPPSSSPLRSAIACSIRSAKLLIAVSAATPMVIAINRAAKVRRLLRSSASASLVASAVDISGGQNLAVDQFYLTVTAFCDPLVVGDQQNGCLPSLIELKHQFKHLLAIYTIKAAGRFIGK